MAADEEVSSQGVTSKNVKVGTFFLLKVKSFVRKPQWFVKFYFIRLSLVLINLQVFWKSDVPLKPQSTSRHIKELTSSPVKDNKDNEVYLYFILFYFEID